jgi:hypothetical protein
MKYLGETVARIRMATYDPLSSKIGDSLSRGDYREIQITLITTDTFALSAFSQSIWFVPSHEFKMAIYETLQSD